VLINGWGPHVLHISHSSHINLFFVIFQQFCKLILIRHVEGHHAHQVSTRDLKSYTLVCVVRSPANNSVHDHNKMVSCGVHVLFKPCTLQFCIAYHIVGDVT